MPDAGAFGFATVFPGWNVWEVWQSNDPIDGIGGAILNAGLSLDRQLRIWVEDFLKDNGAGVAVADPLNPAALRGDQIQIVSSPNGLAPIATRASVPGLAGATQLGEKDSTARKVAVRFYNRGVAAVVPWPHDENYLLEAVYQPTPDNPLTNGPAPSSLAGAASDAAKGVGQVAKVVLGVGAAVLVVMLLSQLGKGSR